MLSTEGKLGHGHRTGHHQQVYSSSNLNVASSEHIPISPKISGALSNSEGVGKD